MGEYNNMAQYTRDEIKEKTLKIIHNCVPELDGVEITER